MRVLHFGKEREIKDLQVVFHKEVNEKNEEVDVKYIEFIVVGENKEWKDFAHYEDFKKLNPTISI